MIAPFITVDDLRGRLGERDLVIADCRWYLDGRSGLDAFRTGHLPRAVFVDLDRDLAGAAGPHTGRHPLPDPASFAATRARLGLGSGATAVAYDDAGGVMAARLVWMLRAIGVDAALLDGGLQAWQAAGGELSTRPGDPVPTGVEPVPWPAALLADIDDASSPANLVVDARPAERFAGQPSPLDPRPGHIPGAVSVPCRENLDADGTLRDAAQVRARFEAAGVTPERVESGRVVSSCGSGVTACHNLLAMEAAGLGRARLYPGSWSQYAATDRPAETGMLPLEDQ